MHGAEHGLGGMSLRRLATRIGTSHRMLLYHFGSKEGLLIAVVQEMETRQRELLGRLAREEHATPSEVARAYWWQLRDPAQRPYVRLFFELYGQAVQGVPGTTGLLDGLLEPWLETLAEWGHREGFPEETASSLARLGVAVARGLMMDLLATGDLAAVDGAMETYIAAYEAYVAAMAR